MQANPSIEADFESQKLSNLATKTQPLGKKKGKGKFGAAKGKKGKQMRRGQSELNSPTKILNANEDNTVVDTEVNEEDGEGEAEEENTTEIDTKAQFEQLKQKFFEKDTFLNDEE